VIKLQFIIFAHFGGIATVRYYVALLVMAVKLLFTIFAFEVPLLVFSVFFYARRSRLLACFSWNSHRVFG
jgi:hypothetical protein